MSAYTVYLNRHKLVDAAGAEVAWDDPAFLAWCAEGNAPAEVGNAPEDCYDLRAMTIQTVQSHLDSVASERGYDGILSLCSYATDPHPRFGKEGQAGVVWRGVVWSFVYEYAAAVESGAQPPVMPDALVALLPPMTWGD